jgi:hypothetical protein
LSVLGVRMCRGGWPPEASLRSSGECMEAGD